jgi:hypothetical protein
MSTEFINDQWRLPNAWNGSESNVNKQSNYSMDFDANDSIAVNGTSLQFSGSTSFALWFKMDGSITSSVRNMIGKGLEPNLSFFIRVNDLNNIPKIRFQIQESGGAYVSIWDSSSPTVTADVWHHVVGVFDVNNNQLKLYYDGTEVSGSPVSLGGATNIKNVNSDLKIGVYDNNFYDFYGQIDGVSIFNYALSSSQVTTLYGSSSTGIGNPMSLSPKPVFYAPLGDQDAFNGSNYLVPNSSLKDYVFDFDNDYIDTNYSVTSGNKTISFWFNSSYAGYQCIMGNTNDSFILGTFSSQISTPNGISYFQGSSSKKFGVTASVTDEFADGNWHHFVYTYDGNSKIYIDGTERTISYKSGTTSSDDIVVISNLSLGLNRSGYPKYNGKLSNVQIFNSALPATGSNSVETLYNNGSPLTSMTGFSSLVSWWKLDASDTYDSSTGNWTIEDHAGSNDGTSSGMTQANLVQSDLSFTSGYSPYALNFDGTNDYIQIPSSSDLIIAGDLTISFWFKTSATSGVLTPVMLYNDQVKVYMNGSDGLLRTLQRGATTFTTVGTTAVNDGKWHLCTAVLGLSETKVYLDNAIVESSDSGFTRTTTAGGNTIGSRYYSSANSLFNGEMSNVQIWDTNLTSAQVTEIYNEGVPSNLNNHSAYSNLVSWWQLGSNSSFNTNWTVLDEKGSNNGTSVNMTEADIVDGVGSYANGLSSGMGGDEVIGSAPFSDANSLSINMDVLDRTEDTPS